MLNYVLRIIVQHFRINKQNIDLDDMEKLSHQLESGFLNKTLDKVSLLLLGQVRLHVLWTDIISNIYSCRSLVISYVSKFQHIILDVMFPFPLKIVLLLLSVRVHIVLIYEQIFTVSKMCKIILRWNLNCKI